MEENYGELRVLQRLNQYEMAVELDLLRNGLIHVGGSTGEDDNKAFVRNWEYLNIEKYYNTFAGKPLLIAYIGERVGDGHNSQTRVDRETGTCYESYMASTAERIVGMVSEEESDLSLIERDGYIWIRAKGRIWTNYAPELTEKLLRTGHMSISVETNVLESTVEDEVEKMVDWLGLGVTLLGDGVDPAVPGANVRVLAAMQEEFEDMKLRVAALRKEEGKPNKSESEAESEKTPNITKKGVNYRMNSVLRKELEAKFPDYLVAGASEDGMAVALLSKTGFDAFSYAFEESDKGNVVEERIKPASLSACVKAGERDVELDFSRITGVYDEKIANLSAENKTLTDRLTKLEKDQKDMEARETARRIKASKEAAEKQLAEINDNRAECERFEETIIDGIKKKAEDGGFVECVDGEGNWCGEDSVCAEVCNICMKKQMEMDKAKIDAAKNASQKKYAFEANFNGEAPADPIEAMYNSMVGNK